MLPPPGPFTLVGLGETVPDPHPTQVSIRTNEPLFDQDHGTQKQPVAVQAAAQSDAERSRGVAPLVLGAVLVLVVAATVAPR